MQDFHIPALAQNLAPAIHDKINQKTKPLGALGALEALALQLALIQNTLQPSLNRPVVLVFAADHGITEAGVSPYPQAVTQQMVLNFLAGGAAINVFARQHGMLVRVVDAGVNHVFAAHADLIDAKIAMGTANFLHTPAMTEVQCEQALAQGAQLARAEVAAGSNVLAFGEMGIGNTSAAAALMSVLSQTPIAQCVGRGTGLDDAGVQHKMEILAQAIAHHALDARDTLAVLRTFGGLEIAMMAGAMLAAAEQKAVLLIDGFICSAALLVAAKLQPNIVHYCVFAHCSDESGHAALLRHLNAQALLNLGLRLGEGTGAVLAYPLLQSAVNFMHEMASFASANVSQRES
jgi:nicotinate-nucleotide--dimethylbenzimidazole phosphoribosyltransferase